MYSVPPGFRLGLANVEYVSFAKGILLVKLNFFLSGPITNLTSMSQLPTDPTTTVSKPPFTHVFYKIRSSNLLTVKGSRTHQGEYII